MSKIFYDHLVVYEEIEKNVDKFAKTPEEKGEIWGIIDEMIHSRALDFILGRLPREHHEEFLEKLHASPHDEGLFDYLKEKIGENIEELLREELGNLAFEILAEISASTSSWQVPSKPYKDLKDQSKCKQPGPGNPSQRESRQR